MFSLDINLLWVSKCTYPTKHVIRKNHHDYYQIVFILGGEGKISFGDSIKHACANQAYIFKPNVVHKIEASRLKPLNIIEMKFYCNNPETENLIYSLTPFVNDVGQPLRMAFISFVEEIKLHDDYTPCIIKALFTQLILSWKRMSEQGENDSETNNTDNLYIEKNINKDDLKRGDYLDSVVEYIHKNYSSEIKLKDLADIAYLSPIYLCSAFKDRFGVSPIQYLQNIRCENAKRLLADTNETITIIAERVGFQSIYYFSRFFKSHTGISPNEYRKRNQNFFIMDYQGDITDYS
ncbi:MAG: AraC family transcriptional regulator [Clostridiaceae bacterium]|nr:AraC family transcriptional regulator [Clostridiaceae bacterium]